MLRNCREFIDTLPRYSRLLPCPGPPQTQIPQQTPSPMAGVCRSRNSHSFTRKMKQTPLHAGSTYADCLLSSSPRRMTRRPIPPLRSKLGGDVEGQEELDGRLIHALAHRSDKRFQYNMITTGALWKPSRACLTTCLPRRRARKPQSA